MRKLWTMVALTVCISSMAVADPTVFGKVNASLQISEEGESNVLSLENNASRLGLMGIQAIENTHLDVLYHLEYGVHLDDGESSEGNVFTQRNSFLGLKGAWGLVRAGRYDSPLKSIQRTVDIFGDLEGDIARVLTVNDNRVSNIISYTSPEFAKLSATLAVVPSEEAGVSEGISTSISADLGVYLSLAYDQNIEQQDTEALRFVGLYKLDVLQLGFLAESYDDGRYDERHALFASLQYRLNKWVFKTQFGQSDIQLEDAETYSLGFDYILSKKVKSFGFYTRNQYTEFDTTGLKIEAYYIGGGLDLRF